MARGVPASETLEVWGRGERFGIVPIADEVIYWFAVANAPEGDGDGDAPLAELGGRFASWPSLVTEELAATSAGEVMRLDCYDRPPIERWGEGPITLLGDAAHPMTPERGNHPRRAEGAPVQMRATSRLAR